MQSEKHRDVESASRYESFSKTSFDNHTDNNAEASTRNVTYVQFPHTACEGG